MRENTSLDAINGEPQNGSWAGLLILVIAIAHAVFYFAPSLYLPFDLEELFLLGYALVFADSGLVIFFGIKLVAQLRTHYEK